MRGTATPVALDPNDTSFPNANKYDGPPAKAPVIDPQHHSKHRFRLRTAYRGWQSIKATQPFPWHVVTKRRANNKRAGVSRRLNRSK